MIWTGSIRDFVVPLSRWCKPLLARVNPIIIYTLRQVPSGAIYRYGTNDDREVASHNPLDQVAAHSGNCGMSLLRNGVDALSEDAFPQMLSAGNPQLKLLAKWNR